MPGTRTQTPLLLVSPGCSAPRGFVGEQVGMGAVHAGLVDVVAHQHVEDVPSVLEALLPQYARSLGYSPRLTTSDISLLTDRRPNGWPDREDLVAEGMR